MSQIPPSGNPPQWQPPFHQPQPTAPIPSFQQAFPAANGPAIPGAPGSIPPKGPRQFSFFLAYFLCLSPRMWRDVGRNWKGINFFYLLLLEFVTWGALMIAGQLAFNEFAATDGQQIASQVPAITITNGKVSIDRPSPCFITEPMSGQTIAIIDTSGKITAPPPGVPILLTESTLITGDNNQMRTISLARQNGNIDQNTVMGWINLARELFLPVGLPLMTIFATLGRLIQMLILAAIGMAFVSGTRARLNYAAVLRLAALAITPIIAVDTLLEFLPIPDLRIYWLLGGLAIELVILYFAIRANAPSISPPEGFPITPANGPYYSPPPTSH